MRSISLVILLVLASGYLGGCTQYRAVDKTPDQTWQEARRVAALAPPPAREASERVHRVRRGDNVARLAKYYGTTSRQLIAANTLKPPFTLREGQTLKVPGQPSVPVEPTPVVEPVVVVAALPTPVVTAVALPAPEATPRAALPEVVDPEVTRQAQQATPPALSGEGFLWPLTGRILSSYGDKPNGQRNEGINIAATQGAAIRAAEHGIVVHAGDSIPGFGRMLLIRHADNFTTLYAHTSAIGVRIGDRVDRGQVVAWAGDTGDVKRAQVHFELRTGTKAIDPTDHLVDPKTQVASR